MATGGSYAVQDDSARQEFQSPVTSWSEQVLGDGLDGIPKLNAYRVHTWNFPGGLSEDEMAWLTGFQTRQQSGTSTWMELETDSYCPSCNEQIYRTTVYTDVVLKGISRTRGFPRWEGVTATFEVLVEC